MIRRTLLILGLLATAGLLAAAGLGYGLFGVTAETLRGHVLVSLAAILVLLFSHCWIFLYLVATGRLIAEVVRERGMDAGLIGEAGRFRARAVPWLLAAIGAVLATFLLGGASVAGSVPAWLHHGMFYLALTVQVRALWIERGVLADNERLMVNLGHRLAGDAA
jgi:hypothetical protein